CDSGDDCVGEFDDCGVCNGGNADQDDCGVCNGGNADDLGCGCYEPGPSGCDDTCGSTLEFDECGECGGDGIDEGACDCDGNTLDCAGDCGGSAALDDCDVCNGDGWSCVETSVDVGYDSDIAIAGFQFVVSGPTVVGASGGAAADAGFTISVSSGVVLAFSFTGSFIPASSEVAELVNLDGDVTEDCLSEFVFSGEGGTTLTSSWGTMSGQTCDDGEDVDEDGICDDDDDCVGEFDECGVCNGNGP
ncbi:MAG: hypothetical protein QGF36_06930, partial [Candidatus Marinimicrobia bacterium]|nr:hypothetical protein [Candidatus Neomarinimicrobiota bacterium]